LDDKTSFTPIDPVYFYQDTWAARKVFELNPKNHCDIGSSAKTIGILSQFTPITMIDIRPLPVVLPNLKFIKGSILNLPFENNSIESISSLCVVEHIGLGRYGDPVDNFGSEKSIVELKRVVMVGGVLFFSVPVDKVNTIYFNAHRAFTRSYLLSLFCDFELIEEKYQYGYELIDCYDADRGFGTGLFMFRKIVA
jgi:SAM-dependent methyltransferase